MSVKGGRDTRYCISDARPRARVERRRRWYAGRGREGSWGLGVRFRKESAVNRDRFAETGAVLVKELN
jgi:hypothetical protein